MWSMWNAPSDRDYYDQFNPPEEPEEPEYRCECGAREDQACECGPATEADPADDDLTVERKPVMAERIQIAEVEVA
jgi:hypothetical protein